MSEDMRFDGDRFEGEASEDLEPSAALARLGLDAPLAQLATPEIDEWAVRRMWEGIVRRRSAAAPGLATRRLAVALSAFATLGFCAAVFFAGLRLMPAANPDATRVAGPLLTREAEPFETLEAPPVTSASEPAHTPAVRVDFADGSSIEAAAGARVDALASSADEFAVLVRRGRAHFRVTPGGPRLWRIEARNARVEVLGTTLWVESHDTGTRVQVDVGRVLVRSPELPGGVQLVAAGESLELNGEAPNAAAAPAVDPTLAPVEPGAPSRSRSAAPTPPRAAELWEDADEARRGGQPARAAALLGRLLRDYPADSQVALAAFTRGVLQLDRLGQPAEAAVSFQRALELGIGAALREDVYLRWAEALDRSGAGVRIEAVLAEYVRHYPLGRHRTALERLCAAHETPNHRQSLPFRQAP
jgi:ferric-dicitrate binding protein FerR (iron transport regulator)